MDIFELKKLNDEIIAKIEMLSSGIDKLVDDIDTEISDQDASGAHTHHAASVLSKLEADLFHLDNLKESIGNRLAILGETLDAASYLSL
ncbi:hypothetical protein F9K94_21870 [Brucella tritici]|uniref:Uncharacterized protein n=1 Tax=Brucella tritici TaxID=94626 RepID=A0A7V7VRA5_9HYPH|nr:hypothetical protein [Brucella tritici]KAB2655203.1 hypothetical protein F9K94_21870 [Brucella tritici]